MRAHVCRCFRGHQRLGSALCANETAGSRLNTRFSRRSPPGSVASPSWSTSHCVPALLLWATLTNVHPFLTTNSPGRVPYMWGIQAPPPSVYLYPPPRFFFFFSFLLLQHWGSREQSAGQLGVGAWCNCTPSGGASGLGSLGSGEGGGTLTRRERDGFKELAAPSGRVAMATGETDE